VWFLIFKRTFDPDFNSLKKFGGFLMWVLVQFFPFKNLAVSILTFFSNSSVTKKEDFSK
jgi:hypothetical protein